jgi:HAD superfamily hydrolase (TIGR01549 family)
MASSNKISTVFFDFGDTLVENKPTYLQRVTDLLGEFGFDREHADVVHAFTKADYLMYVDLKADSIDGQEQGMMRFLNHFSRNLGLDIDWPTMLPKITEKFEQDVYERALCEGATETLEALKTKGYRLGIISNNDGSCPEKCEQMGIADFFEIIVDSGLEVIGKPAPRIFELALERMNVSPLEAAHVGDMYGADVMGARNVGICTIWYNRRGTKAFDDYQPDHEIDRLMEIPELL